jgi:hypothetical protein
LAAKQPLKGKIMNNNQKAESNVGMEQAFGKGCAFALRASKRIMSIAALAAFAVPAFSQSIDNPLFSPEKGGFYIKPALGLMYKKSNDNLAMQAKNHVNETEFPVGRINFDAGYGLTDRLTARLGLGWPQNDEISRKGAHNGRLGLSYRLFDGAKSDGWVWDVYADAWLGGLTKMEADLVMSPNTAMVQDGSYPLSFNYDSFSHGRFGAWAGTLVGKTWGKTTVSAFIEGERTFGNNNNDIRITDSAKGVIAGMVNGISPGAGNFYIQGLPSSFNVDTESTTEYSGGVNLFYELNDNWSLGGAFTYKHRATNYVEGVNLDVATTSPLTDAQVVGITQAVAGSFVGSLQDGWDEYIFTFAASRRLTGSMRLSVYGEYTFDNSEPKSQNGTSVKAEAGFRLSVKF